MPTLAAAIAHRRRCGRLRAMLVTTRRMGRRCQHQGMFLSGHGNCAHQGQEQDRQNLGAEVRHLSYSMRTSSCVIQGEAVKINQGRDGGIGRRVGLRIQCPKGVQVQILFPAPTLTRTV